MLPALYFFSDFVYNKSTSFAILLQYARCIGFSVFSGREIDIYTWFERALRQEFDQVRLIKESSRGSVRVVRHKTTGRDFILRQFTGNPEVYQKLLDYTCPNLPTVYEVACQGDQNLVLEELIQGDTLGFLLQDALSLCGIPCPLTGCFAPATREALLRFQRESGLNQSGRVDRRVWQALLVGAKKAVSPPPFPFR